MSAKGTCRSSVGCITGQISDPSGRNVSSVPSERRTRDEERTSGGEEWTVVCTARLEDLRAHLVCPTNIGAPLSPPTHESVPTTPSRAPPRASSWRTSKGASQPSRLSRSLFSRRKNSILITRRSEEKSAMRQRRGGSGSRTAINSSRSRRCEIIMPTNEYARAYGPWGEADMMDLWI